MRKFIWKFYTLFFGVLVLVSCNSGSDVEIDQDLLINSWVCVEIFNNDEEREIFPGAYSLEINNDNTYSYKAGMHEDNGSWSIVKEDVLLNSKDGETRALSVLTLNDTTLVLEMEQMGDNIRMHFTPEI